MSVRVALSSPASRLIRQRTPIGGVASPFVLFSPACLHACMPSCLLYTHSCPSLVATFSRRSTLSFTLWTSVSPVVSQKPVISLLSPLSSSCSAHVPLLSQVRDRRQTRRRRDGETGTKGREPLFSSVLQQQQQ